MKNFVSACVSAYKNLVRIISPEKCPKCGHELYIDGHKHSRGSSSKSCLNPDCDWQKQPKIKKTVRN